MVKKYFILSILIFRYTKDGAVIDNWKPLELAFVVHNNLIKETLVYDKEQTLSSF